MIKYNPSRYKNGICIKKIKRLISNFLSVTKIKINLNKQILRKGMCVEIDESTHLIYDEC